MNYTWKIVQNRRDEEELFHAISSSPSVAIDVETQGVDLVDDWIIGYGFATGSRHGFYVPVRHICAGQQISMFNEYENYDVAFGNRLYEFLVKHPELIYIFFNGSFDIKFLNQEFRFFGKQNSPWKQVWDTAIVEHMITGKIMYGGEGFSPGDKLNLAEVTSSYGRPHTTKADIKKLGKNGYDKIPINKLGPYCVEDCCATYHVYDCQNRITVHMTRKKPIAIGKDKVPNFEDNEALVKAISLENKLVRVVADIESAGWDINPKKIDQLVPKYEKELSRIESNIKSILGEVSLTSSGQLAEAFKFLLGIEFPMQDDSRQKVSVSVKKLKEFCSEIDVSIRKCIDEREVRIKALALKKMKKEGIPKNKEKARELYDKCFKKSSQKVKRSEEHHQWIRERNIITNFIKYLYLEKVYGTLEKIEKRYEMTEQDTERKESIERFAFRLKEEFDVPIVAKRWGLTRKEISDIIVRNTHFGEVSYKTDSEALKDMLVKHCVTTYGEDHETADKDVRTYAYFIEKYPDDFVAISITGILEHRDKFKTYSTYLIAMQNKYCKENNRVYAGFHSAGTRTGRFASSNPNLQNISSTVDVKSMFCVPDGYVYLYFDYSNMEMRVAAYYSREESFLKALNDGLDGHKYTASLVFEKPMNEISKAERRKAKTLNFLLIYGGGPGALARQLGIGLDEAKELMDKYFKALPRIKDYIKELEAEVLKKGYLTMLHGRRRWLDEEKAYKAFNTKVQGSCAMYVKNRVLKLHEKLEGLGEIVGLIHDEVVIRTKIENYFEVKELAMDILQVSEFPGAIMPVTAGLSITHWADKVKFEAPKEEDGKEEILAREKFVALENTIKERLTA